MIKGKLTGLRAVEKEDLPILRDWRNNDNFRKHFREIRADFSFYIGEGDKYIDDDGFALDAAQTLIKYGFNVLNLNKIWMELYEFDTMKLDFFLKSLGFKEDGKLRQNCFADGKYWDSYIISLLVKDYKKH